MFKTSKHKGPLRVVELTEPPKVGVTYLVPSIEYDVCDGKYWPIMGFPHSDPILGANATVRHAHLDHRFVTESQLRRVYCTATSISPNWTYGGPQIVDIPILNTTNIDEAVQERPFECLREMPAFRPPQEKLDAGWNFTFHTGESVNHFGRLENVYESTYLKGKCKVCPHKGIPLNSIKPVGGILTCPGHHLDWDSETGKMVRRTEKRINHYDFKPVHKQ